MFLNQSGESYNFDSKVLLPTNEYSLEDMSLSEIIQKPELIFSEPVLSNPDRYQRHQKNRDLIVDKSKFLGIGNDGFVASLDDPKFGRTCIKYVWDILDVYPGKGLTFEDLSDPEVLALHAISERFKEIRSITRANSLETNQTTIPTNSPLREAVFQDAARKILLEENQNCYVPKILEVDSFQETQDEGEDDPDPLYFLDEKYTTITMENIRGLSVQDIILNYPDTKEYIDAIDIELFAKDVEKAIVSLHGHKIKHQDITIRNIMFDREKQRPVLIDFGKSSYGSGDVSEEKELQNVSEVIKHLRAFLINPEEKRGNLLEEFARQAARRGI